MSHIKQSLVVVGNGMAAGRLLTEMQAYDLSRFQITVIGDEHQGSYNRIMLSSVLAQDSIVSDIILKDRNWFDEHGILFHCGQVSEIDRSCQHVVCEDGTRFSYDKLVIATGSRSAKIPADNQQLKGIYSFRSIADTEQIIDQAQQTKHTLVVGGGLLGLEAAYGLAKRGVEVTLVHRSGWLLNRQLDEAAARLLQRQMESLGIRFALRNEVVEFCGAANLSGAKLKDGQQLSVELAIIATGITPNAELGLSAGLLGDRAIQVDDYMLTSDPNISALGENVEHRGKTFGLVAPIWEQAKVLAGRLSGQPTLAFENQPVATKLKVSGIQLFSAGEIEEATNQQSLLLHDEAAGIYRKLILEENRVKGIVLFGDVASGQFYFDLMQREVSVEAILPGLIFGEVFLEKDIVRDLLSAA
ncbi:hypothetical protein NBRC116494_19630 [Aurantivibrio plasticivorans]